MGHTFNASYHKTLLHDLKKIGVCSGDLLFIHLLEQVEKAAYAPMDRPVWGAYWDRTGDVYRGRIGTANSRLFSIRGYVDTLLDTFYGKTAASHLKIS